MKKILLPALILLFPSFLKAGGPWFVDTLDDSGTAARWPCSAPGGTCPEDGRWVIHWRVDPGPMTEGGAIRIDSEAAVEGWIQPMLNEWQSVKLPYAADADPVETVAIEFVFDGEIPEEDVTVANFQRFTEPPADSYTPAFVIFDADGSILEAMGYDKNRLIGLAQPPLLVSDRNPNYPMIRGGSIILNGRMINYVNTPLDAEVSPEMFKAVIKHEFGHLLNLAHSVVNKEISLSCDPNGTCNNNQAIVTMFPSASTEAQYTLHVDDKVGISWLYPSQDFLEKFCFIRGEIQDEDGKGLQGVNVIASAVNDPWIDARSFQSGGMYGQGVENGGYVLAGLMPQVDYEVRFEELPLPDPCNPTDEDDASSLYDPCVCDCPQGFTPGLIAGPGGGATVRCNAGGEVIDMSTLKLSVSEGRALSGSVEEGAEGGSGGKKGWCQLERTTDYGLRTTDFLWILSLGLILLGIRLKLRRAR